MKNAATKEELKTYRPQEVKNEPTLLQLQQQVKHYKKENDILLSLSDDITRIREKNDLLILFKKQIKDLFYLTYSIVTLIDHKDETYIPFLLDNESSPIQPNTENQDGKQSRYSLNESFIQSVLHAEEPISFLLEDIMHQPASPGFLR